jgi:hypothetical protein
MKKTYNLLAMCLIGLNLFGQIPQDSLLLYYPFNGNALDSSGNGFDGIVNGSTLTTDRFGNPNSAYFFDGTNDYIDMPNVSQLKPYLPVSFSFWTKPEVLGNANNQYFSKSPVDGTYAGFTFNMDASGGMGIQYGDNLGGLGSAHRRTKLSLPTMTVGNWHHMVGVLRGPLDMDIYIDGNLVNGTYSGSGGTLDYANVPGSIGRANISSAFHWGAIDDFAIYNKALDSCEVQNLYGSNCLLLSNNEMMSNNGTEIYPNPTSSQLIIDTELDINKIKIIDITGKIIMITKENINTINLVDLSDGIYFIQLITENRTITKKFVKQ